jgi:hypothetical protein
LLLHHTLKKLAEQKAKQVETVAKEQPKQVKKPAPKRKPVNKEG